jgi:putative membrane protein insertion efficiency factor
MFHATKIPITEPNGENRATHVAAARHPHRYGAAVAAVTWILNLYHLLLAPFLVAHSGSACRFEPTCSLYAKTALRRHGLRRGAYLAMRRLLRCHPWGSFGYDPVPWEESLKSASD